MLCICLHTDLGLVLPEDRDDMGIWKKQVKINDCQSIKGSVGR